MASLKELASKPELFSPGHRLCAGCGAPIILRLVLKCSKDPLVVGCATGCVEVSSTIYPQSAWRCSFIHNAFENSAATVSGVEAAYNALTRRGKLKTKFNFIALGGDGGTYDIGFQSLSGAMERGHRMLYICYDNGAYMNTGVQRSSATPRGADTTTQPVGKKSFGKSRQRKDLTACLVAHKIPYIAQAAVSHWYDLSKKVEKALSVNGPTFINILSPCPPGWRYPSDQSIEMSRLAVETSFWPLYEVENGKYKVTYKPKEVRPLTDWLKPQGRFGHLFRPENKAILDEIQQQVHADWQALLKLESSL